MWFGLGFLAAILMLYLFYFFSEIAFILPATFIIFVAAGYGIVAGQSRDARGAHSATQEFSRLSVIAGVIALDVMLAFSVAAETAGRISAPRHSRKWCRR